MQDLVAEYQQYQDATYVITFVMTNARANTNLFSFSAEEEGEYEEEVAAEEE